MLCTHTGLRAELICAALEAGKPVYIEKPLADGDEEMRRILRAAERTGIPLCVGHNRRSSPAVQRFRELVVKAQCQGGDRPCPVDRTEGRRRLAEEAQTQLLIRVNDDARSWKAWVLEDAQGIMHAEMVHFIDLALWLVPAPPVSVYASGSPRGNFTQIIRFADGSQATLHHSMVGNFDAPKELFEATARNVTVVCDHHLEVRQVGLEDEPRRTVFPPGSGGIAAWVDALGGPRSGPDKGHRAHLEAFGRHVQGDGDNPCPVAGAITVTRLALKLVASARSGAPVPVLAEDWDLAPHTAASHPDRRTSHALPR